MNEESMEKELKRVWPKVKAQLEALNVPEPERVRVLAAGTVFSSARTRKHWPGALPCSPDPAHFTGTTSTVCALICRAARTARSSSGIFAMRFS
jgi:hypothetical protein